MPGLSPAKTHANACVTHGARVDKSGEAVEEHVSLVDILPSEAMESEISVSFNITGSAIRLAKLGVRM